MAYMTSCVFLALILSFSHAQSRTIQHLEDVQQRLDELSEKMRKLSRSQSLQDRKLQKILDMMKSCRRNIEKMDGVKVEYLPDEALIPEGGIAKFSCAAANAQLHGTQVAVCDQGEWSLTDVSCTETRILIVGGGYWGDDETLKVKDIQKTMEWFYPWNRAKNSLLDQHLLAPRQSHVNAILADGRILTAGGETEMFSQMQSTEFFEPQSGLLSPGPVMTSKRSEAGSAVANGSVFACGGQWLETENELKRHHVQSCERFKDNRWSVFTNMTRPRTSLAMVHLDGSLYLTGGIDYSGRANKGTQTGLVERLELSGKRWSQPAPMKKPRALHAAAVLGNRIFVCGGTDGDSDLSSCERFDPRTNRWTEVASMNLRKRAFSLLTLEGGLWAIGGCCLDAPGYSVEVYDPDRDEWTLHDQKLIYKRAYTQAVVV